MFSARSSTSSKRSSTATGHNHSATSPTSNNASSHSTDHQTPLEELRDALTRIEDLVDSARALAWGEDDPNNSDGNSSDSKEDRRHRRGGNFAIRGKRGNGGAGGSGATGVSKGIAHQRSAPTLLQATKGRNGVARARRVRRDKRAKRRGSFTTGSNAEANDSTVAASSSTTTEASSSSSLPKEKGKSFSSRKKTDAAAAPSPPPPDAKFVPFDPADEAELVELLRRTAELVVRGERSAASALSRPGGDYEEAEKHIALFEHFCERNALPLVVNIVTGAAFSSSEGFLGEMVGLGKGTLSPILSERSHSQDEIDGDSSSDDEDEELVTLLPPLSVATQAVQSVSILIQNVSRATSLYFLLSNNRVNDLINLPLELYAVAEHNLQREREGGSESSDGGSGGGKKQPNRKGGDFDDSPEVAELTTHFVSFLKSLAIRMNAETLQFFLAYPSEHSMTEGGGISRPPPPTEESMSSPTPIGKKGVEEEEDCPDDEMEIDNGLNPREAEAIRALRRGSPPLAKRITAKSIGGGRIPTPRSSFASPERPEGGGRTASSENDVDFPLYARALEFCTPDHDPFVRVTAMNICLNTLRLATVVENENSAAAAGEGTTEDDTKSKTGSEGPVSSPDGVLHNAVPLPFRERLAIARHVCVPSRVEGLVSPIFTRLAQLCGTLEETIRGLDVMREGIASTGSRGASVERQRGGEDCEEMDVDEGGSGVAEGSEDGGRSRKRRTEEARRERLVGSFQDIVALLQDEFLLLEDVLKVGLTSLNEQAIEMMFATFIYPLLLQPLLLYVQRFRTRPSSNFPVRNTSSSVLSSSQLPGDGSSESSDPLASSSPGTKSPANTSSATTTHPFSVESLSNSLARSGLLAVSRDGAENKVSNDEAHLSKLASNSAASDPEPDPAPAKTALFGLASVFHFISNRPLLHLLLTALFHPLAPDSSRGSMIRAKPEVTTTGLDGGMRIRVCTSGSAGDDESDDVLAGRRSERYDQSQTYSFGKSTGKRTVNTSQTMTTPKRNSSFGASEHDETCIFVLSPALSDVLESTVRGNANASGKRSGASGSLGRTRPNAYRRVLLACLAGTDGMAELQSLAVISVDAALSVSGGRVMSDILFGSGMKLSADDGVPADELGGFETTSSYRRPGGGSGGHRDEKRGGGMERARDGTGVQPSTTSPFELPDAAASSSISPNYMVEFIASLCVSVMNASISTNGVWRLEFDRIAAHALLCAVVGNDSAKRTTAKLIDHRRRQSASFLAQLPSRIGTAPVSVLSSEDSSTREGPKAIPEDEDEQHLGWIMDRIFRDSVGTSHACVIEKLVQRGTTAKGQTTVTDARRSPCSVSVALESSFDDLCNHICKFGGVEAKGGATPFAASGDYDASLRVAATSAFAHLQLDAFSTLMKDVAAADKDILSTGGRTNDSRSFMTRKEDEFYEFRDEAFATLSRNIQGAILDEGTDGPSSSDGQERLKPKPGSVVGLVGRAAFPCVCEVAASSASLFTDEGASVVAEGVKWQSLYLVILGRFVILAEPEKGGSGGNGRIVTSCHLSCLSVEKDTPPEASNASPARRLLLSHASLEPDPPGVFSLDNRAKESAKTPYTSVKLTRSSMDLWFEDDNAADHAFKVLSFKITKAQSRRGNRIREVLAHDDRLRYSALFNGS